VKHVDFNCLAAMQFAVEVLRVRHIIVCGHYGCGGITAALEQRAHGLVENWLYAIAEMRNKHRASLDHASPPGQVDMLCEINVIEQVRNVANTSIVQTAWRGGQSLALHGVIYGVHDGRLMDLGLTMTGLDEIERVYTAALAAPRLASVV
jgi:carbonic anhydrase